MQKILIIQLQSTSHNKIVEEIDITNICGI